MSRVIQILASVFRNFDCYAFFNSLFSNEPSANTFKDSTNLNNLEKKSLNFETALEFHPSGKISLKKSRACLKV